MRKRWPDSPSGLSRTVKSTTCTFARAGTSSGLASCAGRSGINPSSAFRVPYWVCHFYERTVLVKSLKLVQQRVAHSSIRAWRFDASPSGYFESGRGCPNWRRALKPKWHTSVPRPRRVRVGVSSSLSCSSFPYRTSVVPCLLVAASREQGRGEGGWGVGKGTWGLMVPSRGPAYGGCPTNGRMAGSCGSRRLDLWRERIVDLMEQPTHPAVGHRRHRD